MQFKSVVESTKIRKQYLSSTFFKTIGYTCIMLRVLYQVSNLIVHCCTNLNQNDLNIQLHTIPGWSIRGPRQHQNNYFIKCLCLDLEKQERWSNKWPVVLPVFHISHPLFCEDIRTCFLLPLPVELLDQKADGDEQSKEGKADLYSS